MGTITEELHRAQDLKFLGSMRVQDQIAHAEGFATLMLDHLDPTLLTTQGHPQLLVDLGSGGGVPALVVADMFPSTQVVLVERGERRAEFLTEAVQNLGFSDRVQVLLAEAEVAGRSELRGIAAVVTARSFAPPAVTAECAAPFLLPLGLLVVSEPPQVDAQRWPVDRARVTHEDSATDERARADEAEQPAGEIVGSLLVGLQTLELSVLSTGSYQVLRQTGQCPERYPRRAGVPRKRPLW